MEEINNFQFYVIYTLNNIPDYISYIYRNTKYQTVYHDSCKFYPISLYAPMWDTYKFPEINRTLKSGLFQGTEKLNNFFYYIINRYTGHKIIWGNFSVFEFKDYIKPLIMLCFRPNERIYKLREFYEKDFKFFIHYEVFKNPYYKKLVTFCMKTVIPLCTLHNIEIVIGDTKLFESEFIHTISEENIVKEEFLYEVLNEL
jgi:hypothetical protein